MQACLIAGWPDVTGEDTWLLEGALSDQGFSRVWLLPRLHRGVSCMLVMGVHMSGGCLGGAPPP